MRKNNIRVFLAIRLLFSLVVFAVIILGLPLYIFTDNLCRHTTNNSVCWDVLSHHGSGRNNSTFTYGNTLQYSCPLSNPYMVTYINRLCYLIAFLQDSMTI